MNFNSDSYQTNFNESQKFTRISSNSHLKYDSNRYQTNFDKSPNQVLQKRIGHYAEKVIKPSSQILYYSGNPLRISKEKSKIRDTEADSKYIVANKGSISHKLERLTSLTRTSKLQTARRNVIRNDEATKKYNKNSTNISQRFLKSALRKRKLKNSKNKTYKKKTLEVDDANSDKVFEFETTISVSLDTGGYMMTIILISQIIIFGMVLYSRSLNEQQATSETHNF